MPTTNPRVNVTLSVSLDALVAHLAAHQRVSKSQVLRELLEAAEPALQRAVTLMDLASKASREVLGGLAGRFERDQDAAEDAAAVVMGRLDRVTADLVSQAQAVRGKRPRRGVDGLAGTRPGATPEGKNPPASNRGVKSTKRLHTTPKRATTRRGPK